MTYTTAIYTSGCDLCSIPGCDLYSILYTPVCDTDTHFMGLTTHIDTTQDYTRAIFAFYQKCTITISITIMGIIIITITIMVIIITSSMYYYDCDC